MKLPVLLILAAVSMALCVATVGLWVRGQATTYDMVCLYVRSDLRITLDSNHGALMCYLEKLDAQSREWDWSDRPLLTHWALVVGADCSWPSPELSQRYLGFECGRSGDGVDNTIWHQYGLRIPLWFPTLLFLLPPLLWLHRFRRQRRRRKRGLCLTCGYDLRAHRPGQLCPECGSPVPADLSRKESE